MVCTVANTYLRSCSLLVPENNPSSASVQRSTFRYDSCAFLRICSCWAMYSMRFGLYWHTSNADRYVLPVPVAEIIIARLSPCLRSCTRFINASTCMAFGVMAALESLLCLRFGWRGGAYCLKSSSYNASQASVSGLDSLICESISSSSCRARPL